MMNQNTTGKFGDIKDKVKNLFSKYYHRTDDSVYDQADGRVDVDKVDRKGDISSRGEIHDFEPDDRVGTAPRSDGKIISTGATDDAQKLVWDNEDASMQDKSYSFDEDTTDADYDFEDDFEFENDTDTGSGQESRYK